MAFAAAGKLSKMNLRLRFLAQTFERNLKIPEMARELPKPDFVCRVGLQKPISAVNDDSLISK